MASTTVSESLLHIASLTKQNLKILEMINESFYTKKNYLSINVGDTAYQIPSFISLENKVNHIQDAFNNLVHAAKSGEAWFNFNGNSKEILVGGYQASPNPLGTLKTKEYFKTEQNFLFKDILSPQPYLDFDLSELSDDITRVVVKKFIPKSPDLLIRLAIQAESEDIEKVPLSRLDYDKLMLSVESGNGSGQDFIEGRDYITYDSTYELPLRKNIKTGQYIIEKVVSDIINSNFENELILKILPSTPLKTYDVDGITEYDLLAGDILRTYDGSAKLKIESINPAALEIKVIVMSGEYINAIGSDSEEDVSDYSRLYLDSSMVPGRSLHIPLEEDKFVFIAIAPINSRLCLRSGWGSGIIVNTSLLKLKDESGELFGSYYTKNVQNIGEALTEFTSLMYPPISRYTNDELSVIVSTPLKVSPETLEVVQINKHLDDSSSVKNIRSLYGQKKLYQSNLYEIQARIDALSDELLTISFDDMSGTRSAITAQITDLKSQQNDLVTSINKIIDNIANTANNSETPIDAAKFRIRGYIDVDKFIDDVISQYPVVLDIDSRNKLYDNILGIEYRYRYKNPDIPQANVSVINNFLFTEWVRGESIPRERAIQLNIESGHGYDIRYTDYDIHDDGSVSFNKSKNINKFQQVDIPISQGEIVEIQARIIWGHGFPYVQVGSAWSTEIEIPFPVELQKDIQITTIIEENNNDIETNRFSNILREQGVTAHINDKVIDQDITYYHRPEDISSGFYTEERRIVPLKDKLVELSSNMTSVMDMLQGSFASSISVSFICDNVENIIQPDIQNVVQLPAYNTISPISKDIPTGSAFNIDGVVYITGQIKLTNTSNHTVRLFPIITGPRDNFITNIKRFAYSDLANVWINEPLKGSTTPPERRGQIIVFPRGYENENGKVKEDKRATYQRGNQMILFCRANPFDGEVIPGSDRKPDDYMSTHNTDGFIKDPKGLKGIDYFPATPSEYSFCIESDSKSANKELAPGESILFPIFLEYRLAPDSTDIPSEDSRICSFSIRNSLYQDPLYYEILLVAKYNQSTSDAVQGAKTIDAGTGSKYNITVR